MPAAAVACGRRSWREDKSFPSRRSAVKFNRSLDRRGSDLTLDHEDGRVHRSKLRRRFAVLALATAATPLIAGESRGESPDVPKSAPRPNAVLASFPNLLAAQNASDAELLKQGVDQYSKGQYEEALTTLQQVKADQLAQEDRKTYDRTIKDAESAANERKSARAAFDRGQKALGENNAGEALKQFEAVQNNRFADEG